MSSTDAVVERIVDFAFNAFQHPLDDARAGALTARVMDALACAVASCEEPEVKAVANVVETRRNGQTALLNGARTTEDAAFLNGVMIRYHDWNDTYVGRNGGHPSDLIPLALAVGEAFEHPGERVLRALGAGQHLMLDMCDGSNALSRGWDHATYVGLAGVVVAGLLHGHTAPQLRNALAMMAASNNMLLARSGKVSGWRSLASPHAVRNAVFLARLARAGVTGPDPVFEGRQGLLEVVIGDLSLELDPARDRTADTHLKMFPAVFHAQAPVEIALDLRHEILAAFGSVDAIDRVEVATHAFAIKWAATSPGLWEPENRETADHSIAFMTALALSRGHIDHGGIETAIHDKAVRELTRKVIVTEEPAFSAAWPKQAPAKVRVSAGGKIFEKELIAGIGHASRPHAPGNRAKKLIANATPVVGAARAEMWAEKLEGFANAPSIKALLAP